MALSDRDDGLSNACSHGKVRDSSDDGDEESGGVHETVTVGSALGRDEEENGEAGHDEGDGPEVGVTPLGGGDGVLKVRGNGRDADIGLLEGVEDAVVVERVHLDDRARASSYEDEKEMVVVVKKKEEGRKLRRYDDNDKQRGLEGWWRDRREPGEQLSTDG